jgi:ATP-binding cassette, subfamily B, bacterial
VGGSAERQRLLSGFPDGELRWALGFVLPYRRRLALVLCLTLVGTGVALALPYLAKLLVDDALLGGSPAALARIIGLFAGLTLLNFGLNVASGIRYARVSADVLFDMRLALYRHLQRLSPRFYARTPLGEIVSRINSDIGEIQRVVAESALAWIGHLLFLAGAVSVMIWLDLRLFLVGVVLLPAAVAALVRYRRRLEGSIAELRSRSAEIGSFLIETLQAARLVVGANAQEREVGRFRERNDAFVAAMIRMQWLRYLAGGLPGLILSVSTALVFLYGGTRVIGGGLSLGTFVAFMAYQMRLLGPIQGIMGLYANLANVRVSLGRVHELLAVPAEVVERPGARSLGPVRGGLRLDGVGFTFGRGDVVLDGVSLTIEPGERVALVGASGSGKSTIADLLVRLVDPDSGRVLLDGVDLREIRLEVVRRNIVAVDQEPFLFHATLAENVRYAAPQASDADVERALLDAGLGELLAALPDGLATVVGEKGRALSVGERQRVAVARELLTQPPVLVLDEPTAALDPASESLLVAGLERAAPGPTVILITHRLELARWADRVLVLEDGRVVESGRALDLLARPGRLRSLMGSAGATGTAVESVEVLRASGVPAPA